MAEKINKQKNMNAMLSMYDFNGKNILEIGCGDGTFSIEFAQKYPNTNILSTDPSKEAIYSAKKLQEKLGITNIDFKIDNIYEMEENKKFDCVIFIVVLHHLPDPEKAIEIASNYSDNLLIIENNGYAPALKILEKVSKYHREHNERSFTLGRLKNGLIMQVKKLLVINT